MFQARWQVHAGVWLLLVRSLRRHLAFGIPANYPAEQRDLLHRKGEFFSDYTSKLSVKEGSMRRANLKFSSITCLWWMISVPRNDGNNPQPFGLDEIGRRQVGAKILFAVVTALIQMRKWQLRRRYGQQTATCRCLRPPHPQWPRWAGSNGHKPFIIQIYSSLPWIPLPVLPFPSSITLPPKSSFLPNENPSIQTNIEEWISVMFAAVVAVEVLGQSSKSVWVMSLAWDCDNCIQQYKYPTAGLHLSLSLSLFLSIR